MGEMEVRDEPVPLSALLTVVPPKLENGAAFFL